MSQLFFRKDFPKPSEGELRVLQILWKNGPATVRSVYEQLAPDSKVGYTTVLKVLQIMHEKGLVLRDQSSRSHIYAPAIDCESVQQRFVEDLLSTVFDGSREKLVLQILESPRCEPEELEDIRELMNKYAATQDRASTKREKTR